MQHVALITLYIIVSIALTGIGSAHQASRDHPGTASAKVSPDLLALHPAHQPQTRGRNPPPPNPLIRVANNRVTIDAVAAGDVQTLRADLEALGMRPATAFGRTVSGQLSIDAIDALLQLDSLQFAQPAYLLTSVGSVHSQGSVALRADQARTTFGIDGTGIRVGTLSDSFDCRGEAAADVASGDLPPGIVVLQEEDGCISGSDEGRAMMQLIMDVAPGADQLFHTAFGGQAVFAQGIVDLADAGADVIVDDVINLAEPMFQDGMIAQAVDSVVDRGVAYFSAAGNSSRKAYERTFQAGPAFSSGFFPAEPGAPAFAGGIAHDFGGGDVYQSITVPAGASTIFVFQWDSPFFSVSGAPGTPNDLDIYLLDDPPTTVLAGGPVRNRLPGGSGDPLEILSFTNPAGSTRTQFNLMLVKYDGPAPNLMKYVRFDRSAGITINEYDTASGTLYGHANAAGAEAVGAAFYYFTPAFGTDPPRLQTYSSAGTTPILFETDGTVTEELRQKPEIVAPDGTNTTFFGQDTTFDDDTFPNFFGTSAAAPHAAAVAALMRELNPALTPQQIYTALEETALDMDGSSQPGFPDGFDTDSGYGFIQADQAIATVQPATITVRNETNPAGATGFLFEGDLGSFSLDDGEQLVFDQLLGGDYTITEVLPPGWELEQVTCNGANSTPTTNGVTVQLDPGADVTCTFANRQPRESITIAVAANIRDGTDFMFDGNLGAFTLDTADPDDGDANGASITFADLSPGAYTIFQQVPGDWTLTDIACTPDVAATVDLATATVTLTLEQGSAIVCTFTNETAAVILESFSADVDSDNQVTLTWQTIRETQDTGFNVYRSTTTTTAGIKLNDRLIKTGEQTATGTRYTFTDKPGPGTFYYQLEAVDGSGERLLVETVMVQVAAQADAIYLPLISSVAHDR